MRVCMSPVCDPLRSAVETSGQPTPTLVRFTSSAGVARILLCNSGAPNPVNLEMVAGLHAAIDLARQSSAHVVVLSALGPAFCVGGDLRAFAAAEPLANYVERVAGGFHAALLELWELDAVVVAAVSGVAAGAGVPLAAAADVILAARSARFDLAYLRAGLTPDGGSSMLVASMGMHRVLNLALRGLPMTADEALQAGLVSEVVEDDELAGRLEQIVDDLKAGPPQALARARRLIRGRALGDPAFALAQEAAAIVAQASCAEAREGIEAFLGKRRPRFAPHESIPND